MEYHYPIDETWSKKEVIDVIHFFQMVENAYEKGVNRDDLLHSYTRFKQIVPSKSEEKKLCREFEKGSGYSCYHAVKRARSAERGAKLTMS
ncbi:uncharacterized protein YktA (UPF0223 family) [Melghiribacillus thermohalophilus]|uniref:UPF0223 protein EDD68_101285 n=1 Tax=Melghiribacillus thermohalophilus TaxID=1324956 RepID=A0A4R3NHH6_9BACI|nr:UPF0223 family protein [Melghiribacillus thermohalophilus]TCT26928.1 uncharacterized protein YktA (UPF0223 family) [Melghiribacillus thermohalophilus]